MSKLKTWAPLVCLSIVVALVSGANAVAVPAEGPAAGQRPRPALVTVNGAGGGTLQLPRFKGDKVSFRIQASAPADTPWVAEGTFDVTHVRPDGTVIADFSGTVNCLMAGADVAVITGTITRGGASGMPGEEIGHQVGLTVADHGHRDRLGWSWFVMGFHDVTPCTSTAPFFPTTAGDFRVDAP